VKTLSVLAGLKPALLVITVVQLDVCAGCSRERSSRHDANGSSSPTGSGAIVATSSPLDPPAAAVERNQPEIDLLHESDVSIAVSQMGSAGLAEYLVDGREETIWKPGPARTNIVTVKLPSAAQARKFGVTFTRTKSKEKVNCEGRIALGEKEIEQFSVDPDAQPRHDVTLPSEGGDVLTLALGPAGAKQSERCRNFGIAEFYLTGRLESANVIAHAIPQVQIGSEQPNFDEQPSTLKPIWKAAPFSTLKALCDAQTKLTAKAASEADPGDPYPATSYCTDRGPIKPTQGELEAPFQHVHRVQVGEAQSNSPELFFVQTTRGWYPANVVLTSGITSDLGGSYSKTEVDSLRTQDGRLWIDLTRHEALVGAFNGPFDVAGKLTIVCSLEEHLSCKQGVTAFGEVGKSWAMAEYMHSGKVPFHPAQWRWQRKATVTPSGRLRFSPCEDAAGSAVACEATGLSRLFPH